MPDSDILSPEPMASQPPMGVQVICLLLSQDLLTAGAAEHGGHMLPCLAELFPIVALGLSTIVVLLC